MRVGHGHTEADHTFKVPFDILLCSVGAVNATFGIQGVEEHCWFLKTIQDANRLRRHIRQGRPPAALTREP
jgi:NADH:ubiquinone reductase (non-electrogenic)